MPYLSDAEFRKTHADWIHSARWKMFRMNALEHFGFRCQVCKLGYASKYSKYQLICDHKRYWKGGKLIFGHETFSDVRIVCPDHHPKGVRSDYAVSQSRASFGVIRFVDLLFTVPFRLLKRLFRR